jgi:hypothetical protein
MSPVSALRKYHSRDEVDPALVGRDIGEEGAVIAGTTHRNVRVLEHGDHIYLVSHKAILTVNLTPRCNANCGFCYNGITFFGGSGDLETDGAGFRETAEFARRGGLRNVSFSGGEPTLAPRQLFAAARAVDDFAGFRRLHTNGSRLLARVPREIGSGTFVELLRVNGFTDVSLSRAHWDPATNARVMRMPGNTVLADDEIRQVIGDGLPVRLSCFLHRDGVASVDDVLRYVDWGTGLGCGNFVFRIASGIPARWALPSSYTNGNESIVIPTRSVVQALEERGFSTSWSRHDVDYDLYITQRDGVEVSVDHSIDVPDPDRKIRRLIQMPNGLCYTSWLEPSSTLFPGDHRTLVTITRNPTLGKGNWPAARSRRTLLPPNIEKPTADLHIHTTVSDGQLPASAVVDRLREAGLTRAVFTDHNCVHDNLDALIAYAGSRGLEVPFAGAEISATYRDPDADRGYRLHLLVYGDGVRDQEFRTYLAGANRAQLEHTEVHHQLWRDRGVALPDLEEILTAQDPVPGLSSRILSPTRGPLARALATALDLDPDETKRFLPAVTSEAKNACALDAVEAIRRATDLGCAVVVPTLGISPEVWSRSSMSTTGRPRRCSVAM